MIVVHDLCHMAKSHKKDENGWRSVWLAGMSGLETQILIKINHIEQSNP